MASGSVADDTRDIVIETRTKVQELDKKIDAIIITLETHKALVNKTAGAYWGAGIVGLVSGWVGSHFPGLNSIWR